MPLCACCGTEGAIYRCARCQESCYCSTVCQKQDWKAGHKVKCATAAAAGATPAAATPGIAEAANEVREGSATAETFGCATATTDHTHLSTTSEARQGRAVRHADLGDLDDVAGADAAAAAFRAVIAANPPQDADAHTKSATRRLQETKLGTLLGDDDATVAEAAYHAADDNAMALNNLATLLGERGDMAGAEAALRAAVAADPTRAVAHDNLCILLERRGDFAGAEAACCTAITANPKDAVAHTKLALLLEEQRGDYAGAEAALHAAIAADPQYANAHTNLGCILADRGDFAGAARSFAAVLKIDPSSAKAKGHLQAALQYLKDERSERTIVRTS